MSTEKFCLKWNDFESNISSAFKDIRDEKDFFDVTLACDDDQLQAHKVILSACSPFFRSVLKRNPHQHPLLYLKGVKYTDLQSVLNFMYHGEVNVAQDELNSFLAVAEELRVKGLTQNNSGGGKSNHSAPKSPPPSKSSASRPSDTAPPPKRQRPNPPPAPAATAAIPDDDDIQEVVPVKSEPRDASTASHPANNAVISNDQDMYDNSATASGGQSLALAEDDMSYGQDESYDDYGQYGDQSGYGDGQMMDPTLAAGADGNKGLNTFEDLLQFVRKEEGRYSCSICKVFGHRWKDNVKNHVEARHFKGLFVHTCSGCGEQWQTKRQLQKHRAKCSGNTKYQYSMAF